MVCRNSLIPKSALLHPKEKYVLKKSNSFINSYSKHLGRLIQNRNNGTLLQQGQGSSFSSDSIPDIELQAPTEPLMIKNDPFNGFGQSLQNLVFLNLYDNQIERISCLDGLTSLTVLLLGKNRISDISGIVSVRNTLRVLDLHGNKISSIAQRICQLRELKSLNLAVNHLKVIQEDDFAGLTQLKELNIKRNRIKKLNGFSDLCALERLWLCHNDIDKVSHMACIAKASNIREITIENNPISLAGDCISFLVSHLRRLALFNQMQVTDQVRRAAMEWRKNKDLLDGSQSELSNEIRREEIISNARTNWELLRTQQTHKPTKIANRTVVEVAEVESNLSENVIIDRKMIRQKTQIQRKNLKKPTKMKRSLSQDNNSNSSTSNEIRLPPIMSSPANEHVNNNDTSINSSSSSIGVNIDSTSSHLNSENDEKITEPKTIEAQAIDVESSQLTLNETTDTNNEPIIETNQDNVVTVIHSEKTNDDSELLTTTSEINKNKTVENAVSPEKPNPKSKISNKKMIQHVPRLLSPVQSSVPTIQTPKISKLLDREREQGGDYLIEICGRYLNVYGSGAIKFIDRQWNAQKANDVHTLKFSYVNFNNIATIFGRIKHRFPNADHFAFRETNIQFLGQLNALAELQGLKTLTIEVDGNPIHMKPWRSYAIYRLSHWGIKVINEIEITKDEVDAAELIYSGLSDLVLWSLPETLIEPLLLRLNFEELCATGERIAPKQWLMTADPSLRAVVGKEALQWKSSHAPVNAFSHESEFRQRGRQCLTNMMENTINAVEKLQKLDSTWSDILLDLIKITLIDYTQIESYVDDLMSDNAKSSL